MNQHFKSRSVASPGAPWLKQEPEDAEIPLGFLPSQRTQISAQTASLLSLIRALWSHPTKCQMRGVEETGGECHTSPAPDMLLHAGIPQSPQARASRTSYPAVHTPQPSILCFLAIIPHRANTLLAPSPQWAVMSGSVSAGSGEWDVITWLAQI